MMAAMVLMSAQPSYAENKQLSEKSVKTFMEYAWSLVPAQFTKPNGEIVQVDKKKKNEVLVPVDVAREVIRVGRISAHAQVCDLSQAQVANYRSLMQRESDKKKWSDLHQPASSDDGHAFDGQDQTRRKAGRQAGRC